MSSQITHTHNHKHTPLSPFTWHLRLFSVVVPFSHFIQTASCNGIPHTLQVITTRAQRVVRNNTGPSKMAAWNSFSYTWTRALHSFRTFTNCRANSTVIPLLPKATFTPSIKHNLGIPRTRPPFTSAIYAPLDIQYSSIPSVANAHSTLPWYHVRSPQYVGIKIHVHVYSIHNGCKQTMHLLFYY